jgi:hypothetical protein
MELSPEMLRQSDSFFLEAIGDAVRLNLTGHNYGLLPSGAGDRLYSNIHISEHVTGHVEISLFSCDAVTASGIRIMFNTDGSGKPLVKDYSPTEDKNIRNRNIDRWDIILSVDPYRRTPTGEPDPEETPPRHPDSESTFTLSIVPAGDINTAEFGNHHLTIGRIRKEGTRFVVDPNYIPPCTCMASHPELTAYHSEFGKYFHRLENASRSIISKVYERDSHSTLATSIRTICEQVLWYMGSISFDYRNMGRYSPPVEITGYISTLAHTCFSSLSCMSSAGKEEMLKYFYEWTDITPGSFEDTLAQTMEILYEHDNIRSVMVRSETFLKILSDLWDKLGNLEYIGQHRGNVVISERNQTSETGKSWVL